MDICISPGVLRYWEGRLVRSFTRDVCRNGWLIVLEDGDSVFLTYSMVADLRLHDGYSPRQGYSFAPAPAPPPAKPLAVSPPAPRRVGAVGRWGFGGYRIPA